MNNVKSSQNDGKPYKASEPFILISVAKLKVPRQRKYYFVSKFKLKNLLVYFSFQSATDREVFREYFRFFIYRAGCTALC